jgi:hypothetical protein
MTVVTTLDVKGITPAEYRAILDELGVEQRPEAGIYLHMTAPDGLRLPDHRDLGPQRGARRLAAFQPQR